MYYTTSKSKCLLLKMLKIWRKTHCSPAWEVLNSGGYGKEFPLNIVPAAFRHSSLLTDTFDPGAHGGCAGTLTILSCAACGETKE